MQENRKVLEVHEGFDQGGRELERALEEHDRDNRLNQAAKQDLLQRITDSQSIEQSLAYKMDNLRASLENIGRDLTSQVSLAVQSKMEEEEKRRGNWMMWGVALQFVLIWIVMCLANYRASRLYDSSFHDPFAHPALYYLSSSSSSSSTSNFISEETLAIFSPLPRRTTGVGPFSNSRLRNVVAQWWMDWSLIGSANIGGRASGVRNIEYVPV